MSTQIENYKCFIAPPSDTGDVDTKYLKDIENLRSDTAKQQNDTNESSELICNDVE